MKIAIVSTPFLNTPPSNYGGAEQVVYDVANGLTARGHKVVLYATDDSKAPKNGFLRKCGKAKSTVQVDWLQSEREMWQIYDRELDNFDIVMGSDWFGFEYASKVRNPSLKVCHLHHGGLNQEIWGRSKPPFKTNMIAISNWMKKVYESQGFPSQVSYNPVDLEKYQLWDKSRSDALLFVGRLDKFKQPHIAIEVAKKLNMRLNIVGGSFVQDAVYLEMIKSQCDGLKIRLFLDATHAQKIDLYQAAKAVLFPSRMGEPFGLIVPEANACGTPVIGLRDGAIPETIDEGNSGFVVGAETGKHTELSDVNALIDGVLKLDGSGITPEKCRRNAERFSIPRVAERYEQLFKDVVSGYEW